MKISVPSWRVSETSIFLHPSTRRRKRPETGKTKASKGLDQNDCYASNMAIAARFVDGSRRHKRRKSTYQEDLVPILVATSENRALVLGKPKAASTTEALIESRVGNYSARPHAASSFLGSQKPHIPVIFDMISEQFFGLQAGNKRLICWSHQSTPDEAAFSALDSPAVDMQILKISTRKSLICGSLESGNVFLASCDGENLAVESFASDLPGSATLAGTVAVTRSVEVTPVGNKRKSSSMSNTSVEVMQIFFRSEGFTLVKHTFANISTDVKLVKRSQVITAEVSVSSVSVASVLGLSSQGSVVIVYSSGKDTEQFFCSISLQTGDLSTYPISLPHDSEQVGLVGGSALAVVRKGQMEVFDAFRGFAMAAVDMPADNSLLVTDAKVPMVCSLYAEDGIIRVATTTISFSQGIPLSLSLQAAISMGQKVETSCLVPKTLMLDQVQSADDDAVQITVESATKSLSNFANTAMKSKSKPDSLLKVFEAAVQLVTQGDNRKGKAVRSAKNGFHSSGRKNGEHVSEPLLESLPAVLVATAIKVTCDIIRGESASMPAQLQTEAALILKTIMQSQKTSSKNFGNLERILMGLRGIDNDLYSPVQFIVDMLRNCKDVSEHHMIRMLKFTIVHLDADDAVRVLSGEERQVRPGEAEPVEESQASELYEMYKSGKKQLANKVVATGIRELLNMLARYSSINKSLFRSAIESTLSRSEILFLLSVTLHMGIPGSGCYARTLGLVSCFMDSLSPPLSTDERNVVDQWQRIVAINVTASETLSRLRPVVHQTLALSRAKRKEKLTSAASKTPAPYQIERLVF